MEHKFQINLRGLIDRFSNISTARPKSSFANCFRTASMPFARGDADPNHQGEIIIEVHQRAGKPPTLSFRDNGTGLTDEQRPILQKLAWDMVSKYPYAGITKWEAPRPPK